jgi:DNA-binding cell septation regulator SpoVG
MAPSHKLQAMLKPTTMKNFSILIIISQLLLSVQTFGQLDSVLYGITRNSSTQDVYLSKVNPTSGQVTNISSVPFSNGYVLNSIATIDSYQNIYYLRSGTKFFGLDLTSGNVVTDTILTMPFPAYFELMQFNYKDSTIYGITRNSSTQDVYLSKVNPTNGQVTNISSVPFSNGYVFNPLATIDPYKNIFYLRSSTKFFGIDLTSGNVVIDTTLIMPFPSYFELMQFNCTDSTIYGITRNSSTQDVYLSKVNPTSGQVTNISSVPFSNGYVLNSLATIDSYQNIYYLRSSTKLFGIDLASGSIVTDTTLTIPFPAYFDLMRFYSNSCGNDFTSSLSELTPHNELLKIYPNPFNQNTSIDFENTKNEKHNLLVYNVFGELIFSSDNITEGHVKIERNNLKSGLYIVQLLADGQLVSTAKMLIE